LNGIMNLLRPDADAHRLSQRNTILALIRDPEPVG
jgi:hypothetical protein